MAKNYQIIKSIARASSKKADFIGRKKMHEPYYIALDTLELFTGIWK